MSNIEKRFEEIMIIQASQQVKTHKTPVNVRVDDLTMFCIKKLMSLIDGSSISGVCNEIVSNGVWDALAAFNLSYEDIKDEYAAEIRKQQEEK